MTCFDSMRTDFFYRSNTKRDVCHYISGGGWGGGRDEEEGWGTQLHI